jgi:hypothetical protein
MSLKREFLTALRSGVGHGKLLEVVQRHQAQGMTPQESYDVLEEIWREFGFNEKEGGGPLRDDLEYVMEKVWFQGSGAG